MPRVFSNATDLWSPFTRHNLHPFWPLFFTVPGVSLIRVFGLDRVLALWLVTGAWAGVWCATLFATGRCCRLSRSHALGMVALAVSMSNFWFWALCPESWVVGSVSILLAVAGVNVAPLRKTWPAVAISAFTLGTTLTNWSASWIANLLTRPLTATLRVMLLTVVASVGMVVALQPVVRNGGYRVLGNVQRESLYVSSRGLAEKVTAFALHSAVAPALAMTTLDGFHALSFQRSLPGSRGPLSALAVAGWLGLLFVGGTELVRRAAAGHALERVLGTFLLFQLALHAVYGEETFLYTMHFAPLLALMVGLHLPRASVRFRLFMAATVVLMAVSNVGAILEALGRAPY